MTVKELNNADAMLALDFARLDDSRHSRHSRQSRQSRHYDIQYGEQSSVMSPIPNNAIESGERRNRSFEVSRHNHNSNTNNSLRPRSFEVNRSVTMDAHRFRLNREKSTSGISGSTSSRTHQIERLDSVPIFDIGLDDDDIEVESQIDDRSKQLHRPTPDTNLFTNRRASLALGTLFSRQNKSNGNHNHRHSHHHRSDQTHQTSDLQSEITSLQLELQRFNDLKKSSDELEEQFKLVKIELAEHKAKNGIYEKQLADLKYEVANFRTLQAEKELLIKELAEENMQIKKRQRKLEEWRKKRLGDLKSEMDMLMKMDFKNRHPNRGQNGIRKSNHFNSVFQGLEKETNELEEISTFGMDDNDDNEEGEEDDGESEHSNESDDMLHVGTLAAAVARSQMSQEAPVQPYTSSNKGKRREFKQESALPNFSFVQPVQRQQKLLQRQQQKGPIIFDNLSGGEGKLTPPGKQRQNGAYDGNMKKASVFDNLSKASQALQEQQRNGSFDDSHQPSTIFDTLSKDGTNSKSSHQNEIPLLLRKSYPPPNGGSNMTSVNFHSNMDQTPSARTIDRMGIKDTFNTDPKLAHSMAPQDDFGDLDSKSGPRIVTPDECESTLVNNSSFTMSPDVPRPLSPHTTDIGDDISKNIKMNEDNAKRYQIPNGQHHDNDEAGRYHVSNVQQNNEKSSIQRYKIPNVQSLEQDSKQRYQAESEKLTSITLDNDPFHYHEEEDEFNTDWGAIQLEKRYLRKIHEDVMLEEQKQTGRNRRPTSFTFGLSGARERMISGLFRQNEHMASDDVATLVMSQRSNTNHHRYPPPSSIIRSSNGMVKQKGGRSKARSLPKMLSNSSFNSFG